MKILVAGVLFACCAFADRKLGAPLTNGDAMPLAMLLSAPDPYVGKTVQVKATVTEVCEAMGCWMNLTDDAGHRLRVKVDDGVLVFPKDSVGKTAIAEGKLEKHVMTKQQVIAAGREEAQESGRKFDASKVKSGKTVYELAGSGAVILD